jgi:hypothetical protein
LEQIMTASCSLRTSNRAQIASFQAMSEFHELLARSLVARRQMLYKARVRGARACGLGAPAGRGRARSAPTPAPKSASADGRGRVLGRLLVRVPAAV